jgi:plasmid stabilization system protein ParE
MVKRLIILPFAETDIKETVSYLKEVSDDLDRDFIREIDSSFFEILSNPLAFPIARYDIKKFVMAKFSFCIYFVDRKEVLYIVSVFHDRRNPKDWQRRRLKNK